MSRFQVTIVSAEEATKKIASDERFSVTQHTGAADKIIDRIDELRGVWDIVIEKLTGLATQSQAKAASAASQYELKSIEFHIGIEAGLSVGLVTKGDASVSITFERKGPPGASGASA
jgi:hypothetical protein